MSFEEASQLIAAYANPLGVEQIGLAQADGRILAKPVIAQRTSPAVLLSAMDGYAVRESDCTRMPSALKIAGKSFADAGFGRDLPTGECVRIFTGAPVPAGADRVVIQEDVCTDGETVMFSLPLSKARHLRQPGSDFSRGDLISEAGKCLTPQSLVGAAASGNSNLDVFRQPRVAIVCCGDELVEPGLATSASNGIPESISYGVAALVRHWGGIVVGRWLVPDDPVRLQAASREARTVADVIVIIGGASVGERDFAKLAFAPSGLKLIFSKVAIKPGKPVWFGRAGEALVVGLPGNPSSALVTARLFLVPLLAGLSGGNRDSALAWRMMPAGTAVKGCGDRDIFIRATVTEASVTPLLDQDSAGQKALAAASHLIWCARGTHQVEANALVRTLIF